jgi:hypothetical protein
VLKIQAGQPLTVYVRLFPEFLRVSECMCGKICAGLVEYSHCACHDECMPVEMFKAWI